MPSMLKSISVILNLGGHWVYGLTIQERDTWERNYAHMEENFSSSDPRQLRKSTGVCVLEVLEVLNDTASTIILSQGQPICN